MLKNGNIPSTKREPYPAEDWHTAAHARLDKAYQLSHPVEFDDSSKFIFFSDCHRGANDRYDNFAPNAALFLQVLTHYFENGFTYIENGDGDELWYNTRFHHIQQAYRPIFDLFQAFHLNNRLYLIAGNHDSAKGMFDPMEKEDMPLRQGLIMNHAPSNQSLFVVHSHQAGRKGDELWWFKRIQSRYFWKHMISFGFYTWYHLSEPQPGLPEQQHLERIPIWLSDYILGKAEAVVTAVKRWAHINQQPIICGHTHMCDFPEPDEVPYFNIGQCVTPGYITGLEIEKGEISLVKWKSNGVQPTRQQLKQMPLTAVFQQTC